MYREFVDSREGFDAAEYEYYMNDRYMEDEVDDEDVYDEEEYNRDIMLSQQELEDFDETDEAYGYFGGDEYAWDCDFGPEG